MRTTKFDTQSPRRAHERQYVPGDTSPRAHHNMPGPGTYVYKNMNVGIDACKFSLKSRTKNSLEPLELSVKQSVPGPGNYRSLGIDPIGKYALSNFS